MGNQHINWASQTAKVKGDWWTADGQIGVNQSKHARSLSLTQLFSLCISRVRQWCHPSEQIQVEIWHIIFPLKTLRGITKGKAAMKKHKEGEKLLVWRMGVYFVRLHFRLPSRVFVSQLRFLEVMKSTAIFDVFFLPFFFFIFSWFCIFSLFSKIKWTSLSPVYDPSFWVVF